MLCVYVDKKCLLLFYHTFRWPQDGGWPVSNLYEQGAESYLFLEKEKIGSERCVVQHVLQCLGRDGSPAEAPCLWHQRPRKGLAMLAVRLLLGECVVESEHWRRSCLGITTVVQRRSKKYCKPACFYRWVLWKAAVYQLGKNSIILSTSCKM